MDAEVLRILVERCQTDREIQELVSQSALDLSPLAGLPPDARPIVFADAAGQLVNQSTTSTWRKERGQYFTPPRVAQYMAGLTGELPAHVRFLEPGAGSGVLVAALAEYLTSRPQVTALHIDAYENAPRLPAILELTIGYTRRYLAERGIRMEYTIHDEDFILSNAETIQPTLFKPSSHVTREYDLVISNPPYFKLPKSDLRIRIFSHMVHGQPNIYALFMTLATHLLAGGGRFIFITPRSFCSGRYFRRFRKWLFSRVSIDRIHVFESRKDAFGRDAVLQENVILAGTKSLPISDAPVTISSSELETKFCNELLAGFDRA